MKTVILFLPIILLSCYSVPKNSSLINEVDGAIVVLQIENDKLIKALGDVQRAILDDKFEQIYADIDSNYRQKHNIPAGTALTTEQNLDITANVIAVRDLLLEKISNKENQLYEQSHSNFNKLRSINVAIKEYLDSVQSLKDARDKSLQKIKEVTGIDINEIDQFTRSLQKPEQLINNLQPSR